jgi:hypothetical protein
MVDQTCEQDERETTYPLVCVSIASVKVVLRGGMLCKLCGVTASSKRGFVSLDCCSEINKSYVVVSFIRTTSYIKCISRTL